MSLTAVLAIGIFGGVAAGLQGPLAGLLGKHVGIAGSIFVIHAGGAAASALLFLAPGVAGLGGWRQAPWYALGAGVLGLVLVGSLTFCIPRLGAAATLTLIIVAQLAVGTLLDHFGVLVERAQPVDPSRLAGLAVLLVGTWLVVR